MLSWAYDRLSRLKDVEAQISTEFKQEIAMTTVELLQAALKLIKDPKHWTQGAFARDLSNTSVSTEDDTAVKWCAVGALQQVSHNEGHDFGNRQPEFFVAINALNDSAYLLYRDPTIYLLNDSLSTKHDMVMNVYNHAIRGGQ